MVSRPCDTDRAGGEVGGEPATAVVGEAGPAWMTKQREPGEGVRDDAESCVACRRAAVRSGDRNGALNPTLGSLRPLGGSSADDRDRVGRDGMPRR
jgi:hypothetical protein